MQVDPVLEAWIQLGFEPKTPLYISQPAVSFLEAEVLALSFIIILFRGTSPPKARTPGR